MLFPAVNSFARCDATSETSKVPAMGSKERKPLEAWQQEDAARLRAIYEGKKGELHLTQDGLAYDMGVTQGAVWQYLDGKIPLSIESAARFAKVLKCLIADISPKLTERIKDQVLPVLGGTDPSKRPAKHTDRSQERLTPDEVDLLQIYRILRELGSGDLLLKMAKNVHEDAMRGRAGAEVLAMTRQRTGRKR